MGSVTSGGTSSASRERRTFAAGAADSAFATGSAASRDTAFGVVTGMAIAVGSKPSGIGALRGSNLHTSTAPKKDRSRAVQRQKTGRFIGKSGEGNSKGFRRWRQLPKIYSTLTDLKGGRRTARRPLRKARASNNRRHLLQYCDTPDQANLGHTTRDQWKEVSPGLIRFRACHRSD